MSKKKKKSEKSLFSRIVSLGIGILIMWHWWLGDWASERFWLHYTVTDINGEIVKTVDWPEE